MRTSLITGEAPVAPNGIKRPRIALVSPFNAAAAAAIPPSAALWERLTLRLLLLLTGFNKPVWLLYSILCRRNRFVKRILQILFRLRWQYILSTGVLHEQRTGQDRRDIKKMGDGEGSLFRNRYRLYSPDTVY